MYHFRPIAGLQNYLFFYENFHYLNIFQTKPEQNIHQNVPNDTIFNPPKQVHSNNNYLNIKTIIFLYKFEQKDTPKHINCHKLSKFSRRVYVRHSKYIFTIYTYLFNIKLAI